jgi:predicted amidohydrolase
MSTIRIAAAQYPLDQLPDFASGREKLARWVKEAAARGAQLLVFPEYGAMEFAAWSEDPGDLRASLKTVADAIADIDAMHAELARQFGVHMLAASGPSWLDDGRFGNAARLFAPSGKHGVQHKVIMTPFERDWGIAGGHAVRLFDTELGRIGVAICYDSEFPLLVRAQAEAGADVILIPSCTERVSGAHRVRTAALARALENGCATVVSPTIGDAEWCVAVDHNNGMAGVYAPAEAGLSDTGVLAEGMLNQPGWVYADVALDELRRIRTLGEMRNSADWPLQPGAPALAPHVDVISLR